MPHAETPFTRFVDDLNREYERRHTRKEDLFWSVYMGTADDGGGAQRELNEAEGAVQAFLTDPARLRAVRERLDEADAASSDTGPTEAERVALEGWRRTFEAHAIESEEARQLALELIEDEGRLHAARGAHKTSYTDESGASREASSVKLGMLLANDPNERVRRSAWDALRGVEQFVLSNGFLDIVRKRNRLGRLLGGDDYYDATVRRVEGMTKGEVFALLDELRDRTEARARASLDELRGRVGAETVRPWSTRFLMAGDVTAEQDPHFPFGAALLRWGRSFAALGIDYQGAEMVLDLVDRKGKYENGFMHGPVPAWRDRDGFRPARIHFTANAIPGVVGSGRRATETLFHEGGHAAHFANIDMPSPCFSQEFAPTSVGFSETQSMFLDSLLSDADWQARYGATAAGEAMPMALIEKGIACEQPYAAWQLRGMLAVCYGEKAIYEIPDDELSLERVTAELRAVERDLLFLDDGAPRPVLSVPHLLSGDSSAYYHGYVLAEMAVAQTRAHFVARDHHLVDNPRIGPDLREHYWREGNRRTFDEFVTGLTGHALSAAPLADRANREVGAAMREAAAAVARLAEVAPFRGDVRLGATIRVVHGRDQIGRDDGGRFDELCDAFEGWIAGQESS